MMYLCLCVSVSGNGAKSLENYCALIESFGVVYVYFVQVFIFDMCKTVRIVLRINSWPKRCRDCVSSIGKGGEKIANSI